MLSEVHGWKISLQKRTFPSQLTFLPVSTLLSLVPLLGSSFLVSHIDAPPTASSYQCHHLAKERFAPNEADLPSLSGMASPASVKCTPHYKMEGGGSGKERLGDPCHVLCSVLSSEVNDGQREANCSPLRELPPHRNMKQTEAASLGDSDAPAIGPLPRGLHSQHMESPKVREWLLLLKPLLTEM